MGRWHFDAWMRSIRRERMERWHVRRRCRFELHLELNGPIGRFLLTSNEQKANRASEVSLPLASRFFFGLPAAGAFRSIPNGPYCCPSVLMWRFPCFDSFYGLMGKGCGDSSLMTAGCFKPAPPCLTCGIAGLSTLLRLYLAADRLATRPIHFRLIGP